MSELEKMIEEIERTEDDNDMHFSLYSIPKHYNDEDIP